VRSCRDAPVAIASAPQGKTPCWALSCLQAAVLAETRGGARAAASPSSANCSDAKRRGKSLPFTSFHLWSFQPVDYLFLCLCNKILRHQELLSVLPVGALNAFEHHSACQRSAPRHYQPWGDPLCHLMVWPAAALALAVFLQRDAKEDFYWDEEESKPGALQKAYSFFKVAGLLLSVFNHCYLSRSKREVMLVWPALSHLQSVVLCWKCSFQEPSFHCLWFPKSLDLLWGCSSILKFPPGFLGTRRAPESPSCACSILDLGSYSCCASSKHSLMLTHHWQAAWCCVISCYSLIPEYNAITVKSCIL